MGKAYLVRVSSGQGYQGEGQGSLGEAAEVLYDGRLVLVFDIVVYVVRIAITIKALEPLDNNLTKYSVNDK